MKRIFLLSTMIISSFGMMNLQTVNAATPAQQAVAASPATFAKAKQLVGKINIAVKLQGDQVTKVNDICVEYFQQLDALTNANPSDLAVKTAALKQTRDAKIKATLNANQREAWAAFKD